MNLYVNGCSFTHGDFPEYRKLGTMASVMGSNTHKMLAWPANLNSIFRTIENDAVLGSNNSRIFRRTIEKASSINDNEWVFIIQLTGIQRIEYYDSKNNMWVGVIPAQQGMRPIFYPEHYDKISQSKIPSSEIKKATDIYNSHIQSTAPHVDLIECLTKLNCLQQILTDKNIRYIVTFMNDYANPVDFYKSLSYNISLSDRIIIEALINQLDTTVFLRSINDVVGDEILENDFHPTVAGHQKFSEYILQEIRRRNFI